MANVKNAKKKIKQIAKTTKAHEQLKSTVKNSIKRTDKAILAGDKEAAEKKWKQQELKILIQLYPFTLQVQKW